MFITWTSVSNMMPLTCDKVGGMCEWQNGHVRCLSVGEFKNELCNWLNSAIQHSV